TPRRGILVDLFQRSPGDELPDEPCDAVLILLHADQVRHAGQRQLAHARQPLADAGMQLPVEQAIVVETLVDDAGRGGVHSSFSPPPLRGTSVMILSTISSTVTPSASALKL